MVYIVATCLTLALHLCDAELLPLPDSKEVDSYRKQISEVFAADIRKAVSSAEKIALARRFVDEGQKVTRPSEKLAFLEIAKEIAVDAGSVSEAIDVTQNIARHFEIESGEMELDLIEELAARVQGEPAENELAQHCLGQARAHLSRGSSESASSIVGIAIKMAAKTKNSDLMDEARQVRKLIREVATEFSGIEDHISRLEENPDDKESNLSIGRLRCFYLGDWENGLPLLAKGSDGDLADLASRELSNPTSSEALLAIADGWWKVRPTA